MSGCEWPWGEEREILEIVLFPQEPAGIVCWQYILAEVRFHFKMCSSNGLLV